MHRFRLGITVLAAFAHILQARIRTPVSYAALGDSYAAGDGAGSPKFLPHLDSVCGRFSEGYPYQLLDNSEIAFRRRWPYFEYPACGGATTKSLVWEQPFLGANKDLVTIQIGGNEVDFFPILNECIQQWHPLSSCDRELDRARSLIQSTSFIERFHDMLRFIKRHRVPDDTLVFVLGYARFFDAETEQCNNATFSLTNPTNVLSNELRREFNTLVRLLNSVIRSSAEAHGAIYIDIDEVFQGHRFCEEGVTEPRPDWEGTWFFRETARRMSEGPPQAHSRLYTILDGQYVPRNPFRRADGDKAQVSMPLWSTNPFRKFADLTRTFHPTIKGHQAIAQKILVELQEQIRQTELAHESCISKE